MKVIWKDSLDYSGKFNEVKEYALSDNLYAVLDKENETVSVFVWNFPAEVFSMFEHVYIMTHLFDGQLQKYYYDYHKIPYVKKSIKDGQLVDYFQENRTKFKELITVYEGRLNDVGEAHFSLSKGWFKKKPILVKQLKDCLYNYLRNIKKAKSEDILWTTFKDSGQTKIQYRLAGKGFSKKTPKN